MRVLFNPTLKKYGKIENRKMKVMDYPYVYSSASTHKGLHQLAALYNIDLEGWELTDIEIVHKK